MMKRSKGRELKEAAVAYRAAPVTVPSLTKVTRHGQVTLPADVRKQLSIEEGDLMEITVEGEKVVMMPKRLIDKSQVYFWTEQWQREEREAEEDIRAGRVKRFERVEDLIRDMDR